VSATTLHRVDRLLVLDFGFDDPDPDELTAKLA